jgi:hypothetical protein
MFASGRPALAPALLLLAVVGAAAVAGNWVSSEPAAPAGPDMRGWDVADLVRHLESRGLRFHVCPTRENGPTRWNAYLTRQQRPWEDYGRHGVDPRRIARWYGVVYCQCEGREDARDFEVPRWGMFGLWARPFVFFGDPSMLAEIRAALGIDA